MAYEIIKNQPNHFEEAQFCEHDSADIAETILECFLIILKTVCNVLDVSWPSMTKSDTRKESK